MPSATSTPRVSRIVPEDHAVFADDTVDPIVALSMGASPSGVAMLSPARYAGQGTAVSVSAKKSSAPPSARKAGRSFATDLSNYQASSPVDVGCYSTSGGFHPQSLTVTPLVNRRHNFGPSSPATFSTKFVHVSTSPMHGGSNEATVTLSQYQDLETAYERLVRSYEHMSQQSRESEEQRARAQTLADSKIIEVISLSSRLEETKRMTKQLKAELREVRARSLQQFNAPFTDTARLESTYEERLRSQEEQFRMAMEDQALHIQKLEDTIDALGVSPSVRDAMAEAFASRQSLANDLTEQQVQFDVAERGHKEKVHSMQSQIVALQAELLAHKSSAKAEKKRLMARYDELSRYSVRLESLVGDLQDQLTRAEERTADLEMLLDQISRRAEPEWINDDEEEDDADALDGDVAGAHEGDVDSPNGSHSTDKPESPSAAGYVDAEPPVEALRKRRPSPGSLNFDDSDGDEHHEESTAEADAVQGSKQES